MKTKYLLLALAFMGSISAMAQDVTVLHMKDGTTRRFTNGVKQTTNISFYEFVPTTPLYDDDRPGWDVSMFRHMNKEWTVGIVWKDDLAPNFQALHGVCFGTKPELTVENCEQKAYAGDVYVSYRQSSTYFLSEVYPSYHYMVIGPTMMKGERFFRWEPMIDFTILDEEHNYIATPLVAGETYYYRTFAEVQVEEHGQTKTVVFYGEEQSFRVPYVMGDYDFYPNERATDEAMAEFATYFAEGLTAPAWKQIESLWNMWRATAEGSAASLDITTAEFDDGTGYRLNHIPQEFYTWLTNREVVIDAFEGLHSVTWGWDGRDSICLVTSEYVSNVDDKWGVPGGKYVRFTPIGSLNSNVTYRSGEVVPGVHYKLQLNFAPETEIELTDSTATYFLSTKVRVNANDQIIVNNEIVSATEVTTFTIDDYMSTTPGLDLRIDTRVSNSQIRNNTFNRIMRVAEIRLVPIKE